MPGVLVAAPTGGDEAVVTTLGLWCTGTRRHAVQVTVFSTNRQGDLAFTGDLCRQGPRPNRPRAKLRQCCPLAGGTFAGTFGPTYPPDEQHGPVLLQGGTLTSLSLGVGCHHLTFPIGAVSLHSTLGQ